MPSRELKNPGAAPRLTPGQIFSTNQAKYFVYLGKYRDSNSPKFTPKFLYAQIRPALMPGFLQIPTEISGIDAIPERVIRLHNMGIRGAVRNPTQDCRLVATENPKKFARYHRTISLAPIRNSLQELNSYIRISETEKI